MKMEDALNIARIYKLTDEQTERLISRIKTEGKYVEEKDAFPVVRSWAMQIANENGLLLDTGKKRIIEHLIASKDAEGLAIFVPGLTREGAQEFINADIADFEERCKRVNENSEGINIDLDIAHANRMRQLMSGNFEKQENIKR